MLTIPFAASFLAGAILSLVIPAGLLMIVGVWHLRAILRVEQGAGTSLDDGPAPRPGGPSETTGHARAADPANIAAADPGSRPH